MKNRFFNQGLLFESYCFVGMRQALSLKELNDSVEFYFLKTIFVIFVQVIEK